LSNGFCQFSHENGFVRVAANFTRVLRLYYDVIWRLTCDAQIMKELNMHSGPPGRNTSRNIKGNPKSREYKASVVLDAFCLLYVTH